jgi:hypothetical protein
LGFHFLDVDGFFGHGELSFLRVDWLPVAPALRV